jgi:iron complex outermembrane recepter protein
MRKVLAAAFLAGASTMGACVQPAFAQSTGGGSGNGGGPGIEEVVVTATRRAETLDKVPASVTAFTAEKMETLDVKSFADLVKFTPGVDYNPETNNISIRGVNSTAGDATTGIYIDDTPIQLRTLGFNSDNTLPSVFDLDRVEVLRGPQGTLFGSGSEGGTIRYITPQPSLTDYSLYAKSELSTTEYGAPSYEGGIAVGGPIIDNQLGFRVSVWDREDGGWIDEVNYMTDQTTQKNVNSVNTFVGRGALEWQPTAQLTITPSIYFQDRNRNDADQYWVGISDPSDGDYKTGTPEMMGDKDRFTLSSLKMDYDIGGAELISNTSWFDRNDVVQGYSGTLYNLSYFQQLVDAGTDPMGAGCPGGYCATFAPGTAPPLLTPTGIDLPGFGHYESVASITNNQSNFTQEVRLQSTDSSARFTWIVGAFYDRNTQLSVEQINDPQLPALTQYLWGEDMLTAWGEELLPNGDDYINHTEGHDWQLAAFGNATFAITDDLKIQAGLRVAKTHFDFSNFSDGAQNFGPDNGNSGKEDETPYTPMAGITYQVTQDDMTYATIAKGYRMGGANAPFPLAACAPDLAAMGVSSLPPDYSSDNVWSYELGDKGKFFGGRLEADASVFYLNWNNIQQENYLPSCGFQYTTNLGKATSDGFDLQGEWLVTDALDVDFSLGYTDARYTSSSVTGPAPGAPLLAVTGDKLPGSPWSFSIGVQYNTSVWGRDSFIRLDDEYSGPETGLQAFQDSRTTSFDQNLVGEPQQNNMALRAGMSFGQTNVSLFADNLLDSHPQLDLNHQDQYTLLYEASTLRPRTVGVTATYHY